MIIKNKISQARVAKSRANASFLKPPKYKRTGFPSTRRPVIDAETTNNRSIKTGVRKLFDWSIICWLCDPSQTIIKMYAKVPAAFTKLLER